MIEEHIITAYVIFSGLPLPGGIGEPNHITTLHVHVRITAYHNSNNNHSTEMKAPGLMRFGWLMSTNIIKYYIA
jgi:hypothetical protein